MSDLDRLISASLLRLRVQSPFFATLALFARFVPTQELPAAGTDGKDIYFNADDLRSLPPAQQDGLLLHAVLHAALLHVPRRGNRDAKVWNAAADIVVNGIMATCDRIQLPPDALRDPQLERFSVEEIYELLQQQAPEKSSSALGDLLDTPPSDRPPANPSRDWGNTNAISPASPNPTGVATATTSRNGVRTPHPARLDLETYWRNALEQAKTVAKANSPSELPAGIQRDLGAISPNRLDWRSYLWRYLTQTPLDFQGFDRRFVSRGLYLDALQGESLAAFIAIDTSGSIGDRLLDVFLGEVRGILAAYPHIQGQLYYTDARAYGPYPLSARRDRELARPVGGGGTSFIPFFERVAVQMTAPGFAPWSRPNSSICVYLTDGYGTFPTLPPALPVLWAVAPGGRDRADFPFGEVVSIAPFEC